MAINKELFLGNVAQKALIERDGKILVCRGKGDQVWEFPGGRMHTDETPMESIVREIKEEVGLGITDVKPFSVIRSFHNQTKMFQVFIAYTCVAEDKEITIDADELEEMKWISREELKTLPMFDDCRKIADEFLKIN